MRAHIKIREAQQREAEARNEVKELLAKQAELEELLRAFTMGKH